MCRCVVTYCLTIPRTNTNSYTLLHPRTPPRNVHPSQWLCEMVYLFSWWKPPSNSFWWHQGMCVWGGISQATINTHKELREVHAHVQVGLKLLSRTTTCHCALQLNVLSAFWPVCTCDCRFGAFWSACSIVQTIVDCVFSPLQWPVLVQDCRCGFPIAYISLSWCKWL